jgi:hypothetical protein
MRTSNAGHEEFAELRHDLHAVIRFDDPRPSFPLRCAELWKREP